MCIRDSFDTHVNVIGYFVIDAVHRRIFNINGDKVSNMTALNALKWFDGNLCLLYTSRCVEETVYN